MRTRCLLGLLLVATLVPNLARSQTPRPEPYRLSLAEAMDLAHRQNFEVRTVRSEHRAARAEAGQALAAFLPQISVSEIATTTNDPLNAFGFKLQQEIVTPSDFDPALLNNPDRIDQFTTRFEFRQPVLSAEGFFLHRAARTQARVAGNMAERTLHRIDFEIRQQYYGLVLARRSLAVIDSALVAARANRAQTVRFFEEGLITRADLLEADVRVLDLESKKTGADIHVADASDALRYLLGIQEHVLLLPTDSLEARHVAIGPIDVEEINDRRSDMQAMLQRVEAARDALNSSRMQFLPELNIFGRYDLNDRNLLNTSGDSWTFGATLQWKLFGGYRQVGAVQRAKAILRTSELAYQNHALKNRIEIDAARRSIEQTVQQVHLAGTAVEQARENLRIRTDRYAQGLEKTTDVLNAEVTLANQRLAYLETLYRHYVSVFRLELLLERKLL